ncbi:MAG TPA: pilus assembly protein TadG-related protein [Rhizomicrobium sp.]|nr:pilus assembly protein TadG-related protein [Rhizomicrobium sp.]
MVRLLRLLAASWSRAAIIKEFIKAEHANIAILFAITAPVLIGALGLGMETAYWYVDQRAEQNASDSAALAAAGDGTPNYGSVASAIAASYGFQNGVNGVVVTSSNVAPCPSGGNTCYSVNVSMKQQLFLTPVIGYSGNTTVNGKPAVTLQASATAQEGVPPTCVLALAPSAAKAASVTGGNTTLSDCSIQVDSTNGDAFDMTGGSLTAQAVNVTGNYKKSGGTLTPAAPVTGSAVIADPYSGLYAANSVSSLTSQSCPAANKGLNINTTKTLSPGVYCNTLNISSGNVTLSPGVYIIQGGKFQVSGGTVTGSGVTIILTCGTPPCTSSSNNWATADLTGGTANLSAQTSGTWSGMLFYQDPGDTNHNDKDTITGGGNTLEGALYFPTQLLDITGGGASAPCTQIIAYTIDITGSTTVGSNCGNAGINEIGGQLAGLVK